jgi:hypothetical protein
MATETTGTHVVMTADGTDLSNKTRKAAQEQRRLAAALNDTSAAQRAQAAATRVAGEASVLASGRTNSLEKQNRVAAMSAGNLAAQFNDVSVMIAAGQAPMMTAIQQGTQINQVFQMMAANGATNAQIFRTLGKGITSMINPMSLMVLGAIAGASYLVQWGLKAYKAGQETRDFKKIIESTESKMTSYKESIERLNPELDDYISKAIEAAGATSSLGASVVHMNFINLKKELVAARDLLVETFDSKTFSSRIDKISELIDKPMFDSFRVSIKDVQDEVMMLSASFDTLRKSDTLEGQVSAANQLLTQFTGVVGAYEGMNEAQSTFYQQLVSIIQTAEEMIAIERARKVAYDDILGSEEGLAAAIKANNELYKARLGTIDDTANNYEDILGSEDGLAAAAAAVLDIFAARLGTLDDTANKYVDILGSEAGLSAATVALNELYRQRVVTIDLTASAYVDVLGSELGLQQAVAAGNQLYAERLALMNAEDPLTAFGGKGEFIPEDFKPIPGEPGYVSPGGGRKGGGGGGKSPFERSEEDLERLRESLATEAELQLTHYTEQQEVLRTALEQRLLTEQEYQAMSEEAQKQHQNKMAQIDVYRYGTSLQQTEQFMGDMAAALSQGGSKMVKISKVFGAAQALISTWVGAAKALELPFPQNIAAFAAVVAQGFGAISSIQSVSAGGAGGGGGATSAAPATPAQAQGPQVSLTLIGDQGFSRAQIVQIAEALNDGASDGTLPISIRGRT